MSYHSLSHSEKLNVINQIYVVYEDSSTGLSKAEFVGTFLEYKNVNLCLFYNSNKELVGFINVTMIFVKTLKQPKHGVFCAGVFFKKGYKGGKIAVLYGFYQYLKFKFSNSLTPVSYVALVSNPAVYTLLSENTHNIYPKEHDSTPNHVLEVLNETVKKRKIKLVDNDDLIAHSQAIPRNANQLKASKRLISSPFYHFFLSLNPCYSDGKALLVYVELNLKSVLYGALKCMKNILNEKIKRQRV